MPVGDFNTDLVGLRFNWSFTPKSFFQTFSQYNSATDEIGHKAADQRVSVHDFHATLLHLLGMNFRDLVYNRHGLDERLTDQYPARVVEEILA